MGQLPNGSVEPGPPRAQFAGGNAMPIAVDALRSPLPKERVDMTAPENLSLLLIQLMVPNGDASEKQKRLPESACQAWTVTNEPRPLIAKG